MYNLNDELFQDAESGTQATRILVRHNFEAGEVRRNTSGYIKIKHVRLGPKIGFKGIRRFFWQMHRCIVRVEAFSYK